MCPTWNAVTSGSSLLHSQLIEINLFLMLSRDRRIKLVIILWFVMEVCVVNNKNNNNNNNNNKHFTKTKNTIIIMNAGFSVIIIHAHFLPAPDFDTDLHNGRIGISNVLNFPCRPVKRKIRRHIVFEVLGQHSLEQSTVVALKRRRWQQPGTRREQDGGWHTHTSHYQTTSGRA